MYTANCVEFELKNLTRCIALLLIAFYTCSLLLILWLVYRLIERIKCEIIHLILLCVSLFSLCFPGPSFTLLLYLILFLFTALYAFFSAPFFAVSLPPPLSLLSFPSQPNLFPKALGYFKEFKRKKESGSFECDARIKSKPTLTHAGENYTGLIS